jgi:hypothetical protein
MKSKTKALDEITKSQSISTKVPVIVIDKNLERFRDRVLFPKSLARANEILVRVGLPKKRKHNEQ